VSGGASSQNGKKVSRLRRRWAWGLLGVLLVVLGVFVARAVVLLGSTPDYWQDNQAFLEATPEPELAQIAKRVESRLPSEWSRPIGDGDGVRTIRINFDEVNAWLVMRLPSFLKNQNLAMPESIGQVMFTQRSGELVLAFDYESEEFGSRIASVFFKFQQRDNQPVMVGIRTVRAGEQWLPTRYLFDPIRHQPRLQDPQAQANITAIIKGQAVALPALPVDRHRQATVLGIDIQPEGIDLTLHVQYITPPN